MGIKRLKMWGHSIWRTGSKVMVMATALWTTHEVKVDKSLSVFVFDLLKDKGWLDDTSHFLFCASFNLFFSAKNFRLGTQWQFGGRLWVELKKTGGVSLAVRNWKKKVDAKKKAKLDLLAIKALFTLLFSKQLLNKNHDISTSLLPKSAYLLSVSISFFKTFTLK